MGIELSSGNWIAIVAVIVGILSLVSSYILSNRALKQSEESVKRQLRYEDEKKALKQLTELMRNNKNFNDFQKEILKFLNSFESQYIPSETRSFIYEHLRDVEKYSIENDPLAPPGPTDAESEAMYEEYIESERERKASMDDYELFNQEFEKKIKEFKDSVTGHVHKKVRDSIK